MGRLEGARRGRGILGLASVALLAGAVLLDAPVAEAGKRDIRVQPLTARKKALKVRGADWTVRWWEWAQSVPVAENPLFDETGEKAAVGQKGPVWFLGGVFNESGIVERDVTIPAGKWILFPLMNVIWDNVGFDPLQTPEQMVEAASTIISQVGQDSLFVDLDGIPLRDLADGRIAAGPFSYASPPGNIGLFFGLPQPPGIYAPAVSDGYWVMLRPLLPGQHVLHFGATNSSDGFSLDVTYNILVVDPTAP